MGKKKAHKVKSGGSKHHIFEQRSEAEIDDCMCRHTHFYGVDKMCETDVKGQKSPGGRSPGELVLHNPGGYIPLWDQHVTLRWRFQERSLERYQNPEAVKNYVRKLLGKALLAWGQAVPVKFSEQQEAWDFEIVVRDQDKCDSSGTRCVLASAFFPDAGRHELVIYPKMFTQIKQEQIETMAHELGHIFGLRHFFAKVSETAWPSEIYGTHSKFSIMNYGPDSRLTYTDIQDLTQLYKLAWSGELEDINGTPIRLVRPFSASSATSQPLQKLAAMICS